ncbi:MAG TPA: exodeoxyribonuclease VII large subunit, partial [Longimicrobiales bacterium]|nr:exodeoxyribonuclease VII large subunit [Longimicrobiales bacterium]
MTRGAGGGEDGILDLFAAARRAEEDAEEGSALAATAGGADPQVITVTELNRAVRGVIEGAFGPVWVGGEIGNWKRAGSGHCYFTLKDESSEVRCVMWRTEAARLPMDPDDGMEVRLHADPTLYEAKGSYQLKVRKLEAAGEEGLWRLAFERLRARLEDEGLLAPERKRALPRFPQTVGVVTSTTGAALRDILSVLRRRAPWTRVLVMNARVQGEGAAEEIARAVRLLGGRPAVDVLIVGRGGGSLEDLWAFNEEPVARAISESPVPVVSAVGHEVDVTISDLVADLRAPTPSAAAEAVVRDRETLQRQLGEVQVRMRRALKGGVELRRRRLADAPRRLAVAVQSRTQPLEHRLSGARQRLVRDMERLLADRRRRTQVAARLERGVRARLRATGLALSGMAQRLDALSPLSTLERGYAIPLRADGHVLRRVGEFTPGAAFRLRVADGSVGARVEKILEE